MAKSLSIRLILVAWMAAHALPLGAAPRSRPGTAPAAREGTPAPASAPPPDRGDPHDDDDPDLSPEEEALFGLVAARAEIFRLLAGTGRPEEALAEFESLVANPALTVQPLLREDVVGLYLEAAELRSDAGNHEAAAALLARALAWKPEGTLLGYVHLGLGNAKKHLGKVDEALASFRESSRIFESLHQERARER